MLQYKWYVFDANDCFGRFDTASEAAVAAEDLVEDPGMDAFILRMTEVQFAEFIKSNKWPYLDQNTGRQMFLK